MTEKLTIDTPEQIALDYALAGVGSRSVAIVIDSLIQGVMLAALLALTLGVSALQVRLGGTPGLWPMAIGLLLGFLVFYGYFALFEIWWNGQTPGKRIMRLRVISASGHPLSVQAALLRNLIRIADSLPGFYAIGILSMLISERSQRLGDLAAATVVVHERQPVPEGEPTAARAQPRVAAGRLTDGEFGVLTTFLSRRADLPWETRERTAAQIAARLRSRLGLPEGGSDEELLERLAAEYREARTYRP